MVHNFQKWAITLSLLFAGVLFGQIQAQGPCDYTVSVDVRHSDCNQNGEITITLSGPALVGATANDLEYCVYLAGTAPGARPTWAYTNIWPNLAPGIYTVETRVFCRDGSGVRVEQISTNHEVRQSFPWAQANFVVVSQRKSMSCAPTGSIRIENIIGSGKGPYTFEIITAPSAYTALGHALPETIYTKTGNGLPGTQTYNNFPAGDYQIQFTDGCGGQVTKTVTVGQLSSDFYADMFRSHFVTPQASNISNPTDKHLAFKKIDISSISASDEFYEYVANWGTFYQYAFVMSGEDPSLFSDNRWLEFTNTTMYFLYESPSYTLAQMRANPSLAPKIALRPKNVAGSCNYTYNVNFNTGTSSSISYGDAPCGFAKIAQVITFAWNSGEYGVYAYPCTWEIREDPTGANTFVEQSAGATITNWLSGSYIRPTSTFGPGTYRISITDAQGFSNWYRDFTVPNVSINDLLSSYTYTNAPASSCTQYDFAVPYIYKGSSSTTPTAKVTVTYLGASSLSSTTATWADMNYSNPASSGYQPARVVPNPPMGNPPTASFTTPANFTGTIYPYNTNTAATGVDNWLNTKTQWPYGNVYLHFNVTDSCGNAKRMAISHGYPLREYKYTQSPTAAIQKKDTCGIMELTMPDIANLIKYDYYNNGFGAPTPNNSVNANYRIKPGAGNSPSGAQITYSNPLNCCRTAADKIYLTTPGKYVVQTVWQYSTTSVYFYDDVCLREDTLEVNLPPFQMDRNISAAYRCPTNDGSVSFSGRIQVVPVNGSGRYLYELFTKSDMTVPIKSKRGNANEGLFDWKDDTSMIDSLVMRVTDSICLRSFTEKIAIYDLNNTSVLWTIGSARKCMGDTLYLRALGLTPDTGYHWELPDGNTRDVQNLTVDTLTVARGGWYKLTITVPGCGGATKTDAIEISVADKVMYWNPGAQDNNWHNPGNWLIRTDTVGSFTSSVSFPAPCTTVHIAGNAQHYPSLDMDGTPRVVGSEYIGLPACDTIYYHYGGETGYPHYLRYNRAKVQYNFRYYDPNPDGTNQWVTDIQPGSGNSRDTETGTFRYPNTNAGVSPAALPSMNRNRWYMLSLPLKYMTGGDFSLGGKPMLYQRLYNAVAPVTGTAYHDSFTRPFNSLAEDAEEHSHALAILAADNFDELGWDDHANLQATALRGVIELPFYMDGNQSLMDAHLQDYDAVAAKSTFHYFDWKTPGLPKRLETDSIFRGYRGYRFVFENDKDTVNVENDTDGRPVAMYHMPLGKFLTGGTDDRTMVGNPLMCHLDFDKLYAYNQDVIEDRYWLVDDETEAYHGYSVSTGSEGASKSGTIAKRDIAPLQGFIVKPKPKASRPKEYLTLPLEGAHAVVSQHGTNPKTPLDKPRSAAGTAAPATGRIDIIAATPLPAEIAESAHSDSIRIAASILFGYGQATSVPKLIFPEGMKNKAEMFVVSRDGKEINAMQVENERPETLKLGLESKYTGEIVLTFRLGGSLVESAVLYDKALNVQVPVTDGAHYRFTHRCDRIEGGSRGVDSERFELWPKYRSGNGLENESYYLLASVQNGELHVLSSETLSQAEVVNAAGAVVHKAAAINSSSYSHALNVPAGVYLVKVTLAGGRVETRKIITN